MASAEFAIEVQNADTVSSMFEEMARGCEALAASEHLAAAERFFEVGRLARLAAQNVAPPSAERIVINVGGEMTTEAAAKLADVIANVRPPKPVAY